MRQEDSSALFVHAYNHDHRIDLLNAEEVYRNVKCLAIYRDVMAEYGAHITLSSCEKPSVFDVIAQESLLENLHPAFDHVVKVLAEKYPAALSWAYRHINEIYFWLHGVLQYHYISNYGASFSENFYDLKRVSLKTKMKEGKPLKLSFESYYKSLACLILLPFVRYIIAQQYQSLMEENDRGISNDKHFWKRLKVKVLTLWPFLHFTLEVTTLIYYVRYLLGRQGIQSPLLHLCGVSLAYLTEEDLEYIGEKSANMMQLSHIRSLHGLCRWATERLGYYLQNSLEIGAFFLQFLDWFYSSNSTRMQIFTSNPVPPPPHQNVSSEFLETCPLCFKERNQETVLSVSGYVFCYSCILPYVRSHATCPVTLYPATTKQLVRIYKE